MNFRTAGVVDVLQGAMDRAIGRLALNDEAKAPDAAGDTDGTATGHLADGRGRRQHDVGDLCHEGVDTAAEGDLKSPLGRREVGGTGEAGHVGTRVGQGVHRDSRAQVIPTATEVGGVDDTRAGGIQFRDEGVLDTSSPVT